MSEHRDKWMKTMIKKHGSEEKVKEFMRLAQKKSRENYKGTGGFQAGSDFTKKMAKLAAEKRWANVHTDNSNTETETN